MKQTLLALLILFIINIFAIGQGNRKQKTDPSGSWKFEATKSPSVYFSGAISIAREAKKYKTSMSFTGMEYKFIGENVKVVQDSLLFSVYIESENMKISLKPDSPSKMSGRESIHKELYC